MSQMGSDYWTITTHLYCRRRRKSILWNVVSRVLDTAVSFQRQMEVDSSPVDWPGRWSHISKVCIKAFRCMLENHSVILTLTSATRCSRGAALSLLHHSLHQQRSCHSSWRTSRCWSLGPAGLAVNSSRTWPWWASGTLMWSTWTLLTCQTSTGNSCSDSLMWANSRLRYTVKVVVNYSNVHSANFLSGCSRVYKSTHPRMQGMSHLFA